MKIKKHKVYLFDLIGNHCGLHYYTNAFYDLFSGNDRIDLELLVNYEHENHPPFFKSIYTSNKLFSIYRLFVCFFRLFVFVIIHRKSTFIITSYGQTIDYLFFLLCIFNRRVIIDLHELIAKETRSNRTNTLIHVFYYRHVIGRVIIHSKKTSMLLHALKYKGRTIFVPHFKYSFSKDFKIKDISEDVIRSIVPEKKNFLFFGNMTFAKGTDLLKEAINQLSDHDIATSNFIFAGRPRDDSFSSVKDRPACCQYILRKISDEELSYLFTNISCTILPYRETFQSGVLETALYFRKPVIVSCISYFSDYLEQYPSFGFLCSPSAEGIKQAIRQFVKGRSVTAYYTMEDCNRYDNYSVFKTFQADFPDFVEKIR